MNLKSSYHKKIYYTVAKRNFTTQTSKVGIWQIYWKGAMQTKNTKQKNAYKF
jgi:hypothetical protein